MSTSDDYEAAAIKADTAIRLFQGTRAIGLLGWDANGKLIAYTPTSQVVIDGNLAAIQALSGTGIPQQLAPNSWAFAVAGTDYAVPHTTLAGYGITDAAPLVDPLKKVLATQMDKTDATLANVTALSVDLVPGTYTFEFVGHQTTGGGGGGGGKYSISGTATASSIIFEGVAFTTGTAVAGHVRSLTLGSQVAANATGDSLIRIVGSIVVTVSGTLVPQFAQNSAINTSSLLIGSRFYVTRH